MDLAGLAPHIRPRIDFFRIAVSDVGDIVLWSFLTWVAIRLSEHILALQSSYASWVEYVVMSLLGITTLLRIAAAISRWLCDNHVLDWIDALFAVEFLIACLVLLLAAFWLQSCDSPTTAPEYQVCHGRCFSRNSSNISVGTKPASVDSLSRLDQGLARCLHSVRRRPRTGTEPSAVQ